MKPCTAIACSGLGHVTRGNETWALRLAEALHRGGKNVVLFGHGALKSDCAYRTIPTLRRDHWVWRSLLGWGRRYALEQSLFAWILSRRIAGSGCDLVHTGDPQVAWGLAKRLPGSGESVIYKDGLLLGPQWNRHFRNVQVLSPHDLNLARNQGVDVSGWRMIPHFTDPDVFRPTPEKARIRNEVLGKQIDSRAVLILAAGSISKDGGKRPEWIAQEIAELPDVHLLVAGQSAGNDREEFETLVRPILGDRLHLRLNVEPSEMPRLYQCADMLVHAALREPFGIVLIEGLASGLPVLGHRYPVTEWIIGNGGTTVDMTSPGELRNQIRTWCASVQARALLGQLARDRAIACFSPAAVLPLYHEFHSSLRARRLAA